MSILPKPEVIDPEFKAPDVTKLESPGYPSVLVKVPPVGVPNAGVVNDGEFANTNAPLPVSSDITPAN